MNKVVMIAGLIFLSFALLGMCGQCENGGDEVMATNVFEDIAKSANVKDGVKEISYEQFQQIRKSGEKFALFDVLPPDSYAKGHIEGAVSFPADTINEESAKAKTGEIDKVIVYCGSFKCGASTMAAKKFASLGYDVLDYKGGLKEWQEKGNALVK